MESRTHNSRRMQRNMKLLWLARRRIASKFLIAITTIFLYWIGRKICITYKQIESKWYVYDKVG